MLQYLKNSRKITYILLCIILSLVFALSTVMTAFAWSDFSQSKTNDFRGTVGKSSVLLHKKEKDTNNTVANAQFKLFRELSDGSYEQIGGFYTTDSKGQIKVNGLSIGNYYFEEIDPSYGYDFDVENNVPITKYHFVITAEDADAIVEVDAYNLREQSALEITKIVEAAEGQTLPVGWENQEFTFTVEFFGNGADGTFKYRIDGGAEQTLQSGGTLKLKHGQTAYFTELPVGLQYKITEAQEAHYIIGSTNSQGHIIVGEPKKAEFVNTYDNPPPPGETEIIVTKKGEGEIPDEYKDMDFWFTFKEGDKAPVRFSLKIGETKKFTIPNGVKYTITEDDYSSIGFILHTVNNADGTTHGVTIEVEFVNEYVPPIFIDIDGEKTWDMTKDPDHKLPESITVHLMDGNTIVQTKVVKIGSDGKWRYTFRAPKYRADGVTPIVYTIKEEPIPGYITEYTGTNIKNIYDPAEPTSYTPEVEKQLLGDKPATNTTFAFKLEGEGAVDTVTIVGAGTESFDTLSFDREGTYIYSITETKGSADGYTYDESVYTLTIKVERQGNKLVVTSAVYTKNGTVVDKAVFKNTFTTPTNLSVSYTPEIEKQLTGDKPAADTTFAFKLTGNAVNNTITISGAGKASFDTLSFDQEGTYTYTISEIKGSVNGYTYDESVYTLTIKVGRQGDKLVVTSAEYTKNRNVADKVIFQNAYNGRKDSGNKPGPTPPRTGDSSNVLLWLTIMLTSGIAFVCLTAFRKRFSKSN